MTTFEDFHKALTTDQQWVETMGMIHRGKNLEQAIMESYGHLIADEDRLKNSELSDFKKLVNTWLCGKRPEVKKGKRDLTNL